MNVKKKDGRRPSNGIIILNDEQISSVPLPLPVMTTVPMAPPKHISNLSLAKNKSPTKKKQMDHYVLQTFKGETDAEGVEGETIDFILTDDNEDQDRPSGEITEELRLSGDEEEEEKTEEIVEHVCGKCYKSFRRFSGLKKHLDFCRFDSDYHLRKTEMLKNLEKIEKDAVIMENKDICFCCGESYDTFHLGHINCPDCPKSFKSQSSYERHIFITHSELGDYPCAICNAKLRSANLLKLHEEQHQNRGKPFACKICGKDFTRSYHLKRHQKYSSCAATEHDCMNCKVCDKTFYRLDNLRSHLKVHLGTHVTKKAEYTCPICKSCFYSLSTLNIHTRTHTKERPFGCDLCEKKFPSLVALKKHRRYHTGEKPYTCIVCNQSFAVKEVLNRHMKRHTGERPHVCPECGKGFIQATQLRCHAKTHIKPFPCEKCDEKFKTAKQLERHNQTHTRLEGKKYQCTVCKTVFLSRPKLAEHVKDTEHTQSPKKRKKESTYCATCKKDFDTVKSLQFHILKVHDIELSDSIASDEDLAPPAKLCKAENDTAAEVTPTAAIKSGKYIKTDNTAAPAATVNIGANGGVVVNEYIVNDDSATSAKETIVLQNEAFTIIPLDSLGDIVETINTRAHKVIATASAEDTKKGIKKSLGASLAAAIADEEESSWQTLTILSEEDLKLKENVGKLLDMLVDSATLKKFGWPTASEENVLCKVIENCGHDLSKDAETYKDSDYATRIRDYVKLLFTVVIHNDSIKELLNNYPIDEVIEYVLGNEDDEDDEEAVAANAKNDNDEGNKRLKC